MSQTNVTFELHHGDTVHAFPVINRMSADYVHRHIAIGVLRPATTYLPQPSVDWDQPFVSLNFQTLDQLDATIHALIEFREDWISEEVANARLQMQAVAAD